MVFETRWLDRGQVVSRTRNIQSPVLRMELNFMSYVAFQGCFPMPNTYSSDYSLIYNDNKIVCSFETITRDM